MAALAACSAPESPATAGGKALWTLESFAAEYQRALCQSACGGPAFSSTERCLSYLGTPDLSGASAAIAAGRLSFSAQAAGTCVAELHSCDPAQLPAACTQVLAAAVAVGQPCVSTNECVDGGFCRLDAAGCARCVARSKPGEACDPAFDSCSGGYCAQVGKTYVCQVVAQTGLANTPCVSGSCAAPFACDPGSDLCQPAFAAGHACKLTTSGEPLPCQVGLACTPKADEQGILGTCKPPGAVGEPCFHTLGSACQVGLRCQPPANGIGLVGTCATLAKPGEACSGDATCSSGLRCLDTGNSPRCFAPVPVGGACTVHGQCLYFDSVCKGLQSGKPGTCSMAASTGQACEPESNPGVELACLSKGDYCDPGKRVCLPLPGADAECYGPGLCGTGSTCDFDSWTCRAIGSVGQLCGPSGACVSGASCNSAGVCVQSSCPGG